MAKEQSTNVWLPSVVLAALAGISYLVHETAYQTSRPVESHTWSQKLEDAEHVEARLWQDPFFAVDQHIRSESDSKSPQHHNLEALKQHIQGDQKLTLLAVMVPNAPYAEQAEQRRKIRYAVLSGLSRSGMVPANQEHIGYLAPQPRSGLPNVVPYEVFERISNPKPDPNQDPRKPEGPKRVVLMWLATEASERCPIKTVAKLFNTVTAPKGGSADYVVLGPPESGTLAEMLVETTTQDCQWGEVQTVVDKLKIYSPFASAASRELAYAVRSRLSEETMPGRAKAASELIAPCLNDGADQKLRDQLRGECNIEAIIQKRVKFVRLISDDTLLANALFDELKLRGIDPVCEAMERKHPSAQDRPECFDGALDRHRIAIVTEWDTPYQRSLRRTLKRVMGERCLRAEHSMDDCEAMIDAKWIVPFSYMRGVDGQVAGDATQSAEEKRHGAEGAAGPKDTLERAQGNRQFDYLRRLAERIARRDAELEASGDSGIGAIAVLGSDPYDKLTILQALQEQLPDKVFVTTNLDARLLHPNEFKWARNLVVVSQFGLELHNALQGDIPPLRDGYQTAAFFATQVAVRGYDYEHAAEHVRDQRRKAAEFMNRSCDANRAADAPVPWLVPQIFEVGRTNAFRLERCPAAQQVHALNVCTNRFDFDCLQVHPPSHPIFAFVPKRAQLPMSIAAGLVAAALIVIFWRDPRREVRGSRTTGANPFSATRLKVFTTGMSFVLVFCIAYGWNDVWQWLTDGGAGEPGYIFEGISLWPAQIIRAVALILALVFIVVAHRSLVRNADKIQKEFSVVGDNATDPDAQSASCLVRVYITIRDGLVEGWRRLTSILRARPYPGGERGAKEIREPTLDAWSHYCREAAACPRFMRVLAWTTVYSLMSFCLLQIWPVIAPFRGGLSFAINTWVVTLCVLTFNVLLFYVFDALYICNRCIGRLESSRLRWSEQTYQRFRGAVDADTHTLDDAHLDHWIALNMIGRRTQAVGPLIYWPFLLLFLIILARNSVFDHWSLVPSVIAYWAMSAALLVFAAVSLRRTTERVRERAIESLCAALLAAKGTNNQPLASQLQWMIDRIGAFSKGAFASYADQHFIKALLLPLAGVAGSLLINYMSLVKP